MRAIDADALMEWAVNIGCDGRWGISLDDLTDAIEDAPTIDAMPVVRCKDCKHRENREWDSPCPCVCADSWYSWMPEDDWFCANGERKKE